MRKFHLTCPIYTKDIWLLVGPRDDVRPWFEARGLMNALSSDSDMEAGRIDFKNQTRKDFYLWAGDFRHNAGDISCLIHESFHIVSMVLDSVGLKHTHDTEEAYAYLLTWLINEVFLRLLKPPSSMVKANRKKGHKCNYRRGHGHRT